MLFAQKAGAIEFFTEVEELLDFPPVPAASSYPEWFKKMPPAHAVAPDKGFPFGLTAGLRLSNVNATVRRCPGLISYMSTGWLVPLWSDFVVQVRSNSIYAFGSNESAYVSLHSREKHFHTMPNLQGYYPEPLKFKNPWKVKTPPGYSILVCAPHYYYEQRFQVAPGVIDTDNYHHMHVNAFFRNESADHELKMGVPFIQVIPFQRSTLQAEVRAASEGDKQRLKRLRFRSDRFFGKNKSMRET